MARIRSVKPALRTSEVVASWPVEVRYFWVLLWGYLDDKGRGLDVPKTIAGDCFPHDDKYTAAAIKRFIDLIANTKTNDKDAPLCRYEVGGRRYLHSTNWDEHQRPARPTPSRLPPCPLHESPPEDSEIPNESPPENHGEFSESPVSPQVLELGVRSLTDGSRSLTDEEFDSSGRRLTEPPTAAAAMIFDRTDATQAEAEAVAAAIARQRKPRNLPGFVRSLATDELVTMLADLRRDAEGSEVVALIAEARKGPPCRHGDPGGATPHPTTGKPLCPLCRKRPAKATP